MHATRFTRRDALKALGGGLAVSIAAACGPARSLTSSSTPAASPTSTAPAVVKQGSVLILGQTTGIPNTDPFPSSPAQNAFKWAMFSPLVSLDSSARPVPALAESWSLSEDNRVLTFRLRQGVLFHSGRPFTAEAAKWNVDRAQDPRNQLAVGGELRGVEARATDATTLELHLPDVSPHIFSLLAGLLIADPESNIVEAAAGTGAFKLDSFESGSEMRLVRNPNYWRSARPYLDGVSIKTLPDTQAAAATLEAGAAHVVWCQPSDVQRLMSGAATTAVSLAGSGSFEVLISTVDEPFTDKRVRQAIDLALDRKRFAAALMHGLTEPTYTMWVRKSPVWDASIDVGEFNLDKARKLLTEAGYGNGFRTKILANTTYSELPRFAQIMQSDLAKVGVDLTIEPIDGVQMNREVTQAKFTSLVAHSYGYGDQDPAMQFTAFVFRPSGNASRFQSEKYVQLVETARREPDLNKRIALYRQIGAFLADEAFVLPLANNVYPFGLRSNVQGFSRQPIAGSPVLEDIWLA